MKPDIRKILNGQASSIKEPVALLLSGGIDSSALLFALQSQGVDVTCYSFRLCGVESTDFLSAKDVAKTFGVKLVEIILPTFLNILKDDLKRLAKLGAKSKTDFECGWPMLYAYEAIKEKLVWSGMGADGHFCISKKGMIHFRNNIDTFRKELYSDKRYAQQPLHRKLAKVHGIKTVFPYLSSEMKSAFLGTTWDEVNRPKEKQVIIDAYSDEFSKMKVRRHCNFHLGDSGIAAHFTKLLETDLNKRGCKSVVGIYNDVVKGLKA